MTRDELEAALRRNLTDTGVPATFHNTLVDAFLPAADNYAVYTQGITAERRTALAATQRAVRKPKVHRRDPHRSTKTTCGLSTAQRDVTNDKDAVTCQRCNPNLEASRA